MLLRRAASTVRSQCNGSRLRHRKPSAERILNHDRYYTYRAGPQCRFDRLGVDAIDGAEVRFVHRAALRPSWRMHIQLQLYAEPHIRQLRLLL